MADFPRSWARAMSPGAVPARAEENDGKFPSSPTHSPSRQGLESFPFVVAEVCSGHCPWTRPGDLGRRTGALLVLPLGPICLVQDFSPWEEGGDLPAPFWGSRVCLC